jgi:hypothetical protein
MRVLQKSFPSTVEGGSPIHSGPQRGRSGASQERIDEPRARQALIVIRSNARPLRPASGLVHDLIRLPTADSSSVWLNPSAGSTTIPIAIDYQRRLARTYLDAQG